MKEKWICGSKACAEVNPGGLTECHGCGRPRTPEDPEEMRKIHKQKLPERAAETMPVDSRAVWTKEHEGGVMG